MLKKIKDFLFGKPVPAFGPVAVEPPAPVAPDEAAVAKVVAEPGIEPAWPFPGGKPVEGVAQQEVEAAQPVVTPLPAVKKARKPRRRKVTTPQT
jgi:hypothetical protein